MLLTPTLEREMERRSPESNLQERVSRRQLIPQPSPHLVRSTQPLVISADHKSEHRAVERTDAAERRGEQTHQAEAVAVGSGGVGKGPLPHAIEFQQAELARMPTHFGVITSAKNMKSREYDCWGTIYVV